MIVDSIMLHRVFFIVCFLVRTTDTATQSQLQSQPHTLHIPHIPPFHQYSVSFIVFFNKDNKYSDRSIFSRRRHYLCVRLLQAPDISPLLLHVASIWKVTGGEYWKRRLMGPIALGHFIILHPVMLYYYTCDTIT